MQQKMEKISKIIEKVCKEYDFLIGNYYKKMGDYVSCKDQPYFINGESKNLIEFQEKSQQYPFKCGSGLPGRVWLSLKFEWCSNV